MICFSKTSSVRKRHKVKSILIANSNEGWSSELKAGLISKGYDCQISLNGKESQLKISQNSFFGVVIDIDVTNHSCLDVLKYVKLNHQSALVLVYFATKEKYTQLSFDEGILKKMGVDKVFIGTSAAKEIPQYFYDLDATKWKNIKAVDSNAPETSNVVNISDLKMTRIKGTEFADGSIAIFDHYLRLNSNRFVKVLNQGENFSSDRVKGHAADKTEYIYFQTNDRTVYINYMDELTDKLIRSSSSEKAIKIVSTLTTKVIEEIYTEGINPQVILEGMNLCKNTMQMVKSEAALSKMLDEYQELSTASYSHLFLTTFFSSVICQNLDWAGAKTKETIGIGALLHDIGLLKVPASIRDKHPSVMTPKEIAVYNQHPAYGYESLQKFSGISEQVRQIVYQHHETSCGSGYPNGLGNLKIYPLAKIITLADAFADILMTNKIPPIQGIRILLSDKEKLSNYDATVIRALVTGFIKKVPNAG